MTTFITYSSQLSPTQREGEGRGEGGRQQVFTLLLYEMLRKHRIGISLDDLFFNLELTACKRVSIEWDKIAFSREDEKQNQVLKYLKAYDVP